MRYEHYHASAAPFLLSRSTLCHPFLPCDIFAVLTSDLSEPEMCYSAVALSITAGCRMAPRGVTLQGPNTNTNVSINHWSGTFQRSIAAPTMHTVNVLLFMFIPHCIVNHRLSRQLTKNSPQFLVAILVVFLLPGGCLSDQLSMG